MIDEIEQRRAEIEDLCRRFGVRRLEVFGSATTGEFRPDASDVDFLVDFESPEERGYADRYFGLLESLEDLLARRVDLVVDRAIKNSFFRRSVDRTKKLLYAA